ncbi:MAG: right-handed parallel beta-helix repeat-containing protein [Candidatus Kapabacteria bacterium]|nr:right-handed parallel beta-helix repeat-containing protein [Candidatus Kapabacteria bacterium]
MYWFLAFTGGCIFFGTALTAQIHIGPGQTYANIQQAAPFIRPGDTVYLHAGEYRGYNYYRGLKGRPDAWITIRPYRNDRPVIRGAWQFSAMEYVRFENLTFQGNTVDTAGPFLNIDNGGDCATQSRHIVIASCYFGDNRVGNTLKFGGVDSFEVVGCTFRNQGDGNAGLALNVCHDGWVHDNVFENVQGRAIQAKLGTRNVVIERNLFLDCGTLDAALRIGEAGGLQFHCPGDEWTAREVFVYSNIIIGGRAAFAIGQAQNCEIVHNTIVNPQQFVFRVLAEQPVFACDSNRIVNNIFYLSATRYFNGSPNPASNNIDYSTFVVDHNLFYYTGDPNWLPNPNGGPYDMEELTGIRVTNSIRGNPLFVAVERRDFHLRPGSPAIGAGAVVQHPKRDYYGFPFKSPPSVGAVEDTSGITGVDIAGVGPVLYPNPASGVVFIAGVPLGATVELWTLMGERCYPSLEYLPGGLVRLDLMGIPSGAYVLRCRTANSLWAKKLLVR